MKNICYIVWQERNNFGIPIIDEQHRGVVSIINSLHYSIQTGRGETIITPTMIMLEQYTVIHFQTEEALLKEARYPGLNDHLALHRKLVEKTREYSRSVNREPEVVLQFLKNWWLHHINTEDRKYVPLVAQLFE